MRIFYLCLLLWSACYSDSKAISQPSAEKNRSGHPPVIFGIAGNTVRTQSYGVSCRPVVWGVVTHFILEGELVGDLKFDRDTGRLSSGGGVNLTYFQNAYATASRRELSYRIRAVNEYGESAPYPFKITIENRYGGEVPPRVVQLAGEMPARIQAKVGEKFLGHWKAIKRVIAGNLPPGIEIDQVGNLIGEPKEKGRWEAFLLIGAEGDAFNVGSTKPHPYGEQVVSVTFEIEGDEKSIHVETKTQDTAPSSPKVESPKQGSVNIPMPKPSKPISSGSAWDSLSRQDDLAIIPRIVGTKYLRTKVGEKFNHQLQIWPPERSKEVTFEIISGEMPPGIELDKINGELKGSPQKAGSYVFTIVAKRGNEQGMAFSMTLKVD
ncbi:MAG: hypothetical protein NZM04_04505 [Methylacidiphilales bacterium]|nr:hypothetical protein [Candidatus Methylacidiphilales bacterium]